MIDDSLFTRQIVSAHTVRGPTCSQIYWGPILRDIIMKVSVQTSMTFDTDCTNRFKIFLKISVVTKLKKKL